VLLLLGKGTGYFWVWQESNSEILHTSGAVRWNSRAENRPSNICRWHWSQTWKVAFLRCTPARALVHGYLSGGTPCFLYI